MDRGGRIIRILFAWKLSYKVWIGLFFILFIWFWTSLPNLLFDSPTSYVIEDEKGILLGASIAGDGQWRFPFHLR
jgi:penicillin-binding protein 1C